MVQKIMNVIFSNSESARLFRSAAESPYENAIAMFYLGLLLRTGDGDVQDEAETVD
jgi:TPR repeat protein